MVKFRKKCPFPIEPKDCLYYGLGGNGPDEYSAVLKAILYEGEEESFRPSTDRELMGY